MTEGQKGFLSRLRQVIAVLSGGDRTEPAEVAPAADDVAALRSRIRGCEMDLEDRDAQIGRLKKEFDILRSQAETEKADACTAELSSLAKRLAPILSQAPTMRAMHQEGKPIDAADLLKLFEKVERAIREAGIEPIGSVGEVAPFDARFHQRMSGGDVNEGDRVRIRFVGYRLGDTILTKAMVSREG